MVFMERLLQRVQLIRGGGNPLDGENIMAVRLHREHQAGARGAIVEQDGASAADAVLAAQMRAGQSELMADEIRQRDADLDLLLVALAVHRYRNLPRFFHCRS